MKRIKKKVNNNNIEDEPKLLYKQGNKYLMSGDVEMAIRKYIAATDLGHLSAAFKVGLIYENGTGFLPSLSKKYH